MIIENGLESCVHSFPNAVQGDLLREGSSVFGRQQRSMIS